MDVLLRGVEGLFYTPPSRTITAFLILLSLWGLIVGYQAYKEFPKTSTAQLIVVYALICPIWAILFSFCLLLSIYLWYCL